jgi:mRNA interferase MazF
MITSATHRSWQGDVVISNLAEAGLPAASIVRTAKIATIKASAAEPRGTLPLEDRAAVIRHLSHILGYASATPAT